MVHLVMGDMEKPRLAVVMLGPPGAGKGTQARMMSEALKFPHISTGDMLREALREQTELGKKAKTFMDSGSLVPDCLVDAMVSERLALPDAAEGFVLDGYPRTIPQADFLMSLLGKDAKIVPIGVEVGERELIKRLSSRWNCPSCGRVFNANLDPAKAGGECCCGARLIQRKDDTAAVITERLEVYHRTTEPLVQYYRKRGGYVEVDGERDMAGIFEAIMAAVEYSRNVREDS